MPIFKAAPRIASEYAADGKRIFDPVGLNELKAARFESWLDGNGINYFENTGLEQTGKAHRLWRGGNTRIFGDYTFPKMRDGMMEILWRCCCCRV